MKTDFDQSETETESAYSSEYRKLYQMRMELRKYLVKPKFKWNEVIIPVELSDALKETILFPLRFPQFFVHRRPGNVMLYGVHYL